MKTAVNKRQVTGQLSRGVVIEIACLRRHQQCIFPSSSSGADGSRGSCCPPLRVVITRELSSLGNMEAATGVGKHPAHRTEIWLVLPSPPHRQPRVAVIEHGCCVSPPIGRGATQDRIIVAIEGAWRLRLALPLSPLRCHRRRRKLYFATSSRTRSRSPSRLAGVSGIRMDGNQSPCGVGLGAGIHGYSNLELTRLERVVVRVAQTIRYFAT
ncbi:hypothetical protein EDB84DRAFT_1676273 [Lactarius hengduanensis]|nr:hypothetical protein EDB84DRAFT_1676273 [Lactarius hengduanensis]